MNWKEILASYPENEDMIFLYEEWGETPYLRELFTLLSEYQPDWNKEKELGSWAAEFMLDLLEETEAELGEQSCEDIRAYIDQEGEKNGFPILI